MTTPCEIVQTAARKGIDAIGFADHLSPETDSSIFEGLRYDLRADRTDVQVFVGAEADLLNPEGDIAATKPLAERLDYVMAAPHHFHLPWVEKPSVSSIADLIDHEHEALLAATRNPLVDVLAHPWAIRRSGLRVLGISEPFRLSLVPETYLAELATSALIHNVAVEINLATLSYGEAGKLTIAQFMWNWRPFIEILQHRALISIGSGAHHLYQVGKTKLVMPALELMGLTEARMWHPGKTMR